MKLFFELGNCRLHEDSIFRAFAQAAAELLADGHRLAVLHGAEKVSVKQVPAPCAGLGNGSDQNPVRERQLASLILSGTINRKLVGSLGLARVAAFGLHATDGNIVRTRVTGYEEHHSILGIAGVNPLWIETISRHGAVPVLTNIALGPNGQYSLVNLDQMAAACAIAWNADALFFLTRSQGVTTSDGSVLRWLNCSDIRLVTQASEFAGTMRSQLNACREALKCGVGRARVFPLSEIGQLPLFYVSRINAGTEVILS